MTGGAPLLVLLPGLDGTGEMFHPFLEKLPPDFRVQVVSYPRDRCLAIPELADLSLERIPPGRPLVILGESFSGPVALELSSRPGLDIRGFVFCATFTRPPFPFLIRLSRFLPLEAILRIPRPPWYARLVSLGPEAPREMVSHLKKVNASVRPGVLAHRIRSLDHIDYRDSLRRISVPSLYLQAARDRTVPPSCLAPFRENLRDLRVERIDGPHLLLQTRPGECARIVAGFLRSCS